MALMHAFRTLEPEDRGKQLADMLQLLIAHGDEWFVEQMISMTQHRIAWVIERDSPNHPFGPKQ